MNFQGSYILFGYIALIRKHKKNCSSLNVLFELVKASFEIPLTNYESDIQKMERKALDT